MYLDVYKKFQSYNGFINKDTALCQIWHTMKMAEQSCCHGEKRSIMDDRLFSAMCGMK